MSIILATWIAGLLGLYAACGILFAVPFVFKGVGRVDPVAKEGTWGFRLLILPGVAAFWPLFARRLLARVKTPPVECNPHRAAVSTPEETP